jgi:uncharacterized protein
VSEPAHGYVGPRVLRFQVGFLLAEGKGHSSDTVLDVPRVRVADDLTLEYLRGTLRFSRTSRGILVQGELETQVPAECSRCLDEVPARLEVPLEEMFVYPPEPGAEFNVPETGLLDLAPLIREEIILRIPIGILCRPECAGLCPTCGKNLNLGPCDCPEEDIDPRLASLKTLKERLSED